MMKDRVFNQTLSSDMAEEGMQRLTGQVNNFLINVFLLQAFSSVKILISSMDGWSSRVSDLE